jgi:hypothetical protein
MRRRLLTIRDLVKAKGKLGCYRLKPHGTVAITIKRSTLKRFDSQLESDYADHLDLLKRSGEIRGYYCKPFSMILPGRNNRYTPDFLVKDNDGRIEIHETKGEWIKNRREGIVKLKTAAGLNPWATFYLVTRRGRQWIRRVCA